MTEVSYPQQGVLVGDAVQAPYDADEFALRFMANMTGFARRANYGPVFGYDDGIHYSLEVNQTSVASANVLLRPGAALITGTIYQNDADITLAVGVNASGNPRIDTVILRKDYTLQTVRATIVQGTPAASPVPPALTQSASVWEIPLADITVANGFSTLTDSNIIPKHQWVNAGNGIYLDNILNNSGVTLEKGDAVIWDSVFKSVTTTTTANHPRVAGIWESRSTANGGYGRILQRGYARIRLRVQNTNASGGTVPIGSLVVTGNQAKKATIIDSNNDGLLVPFTGTELTTGTNNTGHAPIQLGILQESIVLAGASTFDDYAWVYVDLKQQRNPLFTKLFDAGGTSGGGFTSGAWQTRTLNRRKTGMDATNLADTNNNPYVSLASNQFTLQPGVYHIRAHAPAFRVDFHQTRIFNITNSGTLSEGTQEYSPAAIDGTVSRSFVDAVVGVKTATVFELQHRCTTTRASDGFGKGSASLGVLIIYSVVEIARLGEIS